MVCLDLMVTLFKRCFAYYQSIPARNAVIELGLIKLNSKVNPELIGNGNFFL